MNTTHQQLSLTNVLGLDASQLGDQPLSQGAARFPINFAGVETALRESAERSHGWLRHWLPLRALELQVADRKLRFSGLAEFEFSLSGRTEYPMHRLGELLAMAPVELKRLATNIRQVEKRLADLLAESLDAPGCIGHMLRELDPKLFSQDHDWRELMLAVARSGAGFDDFKKLALVKYMQYLGARQDVLRSIYLDKKYQRATGDAGFDPLATYAAGRSSSGTAAGVAADTLACEDLTRVAAVRSEAACELSPLPRGETVCLNLGDSDELPMQLSQHHEFRLLAGQPMRLQDPDGGSYVLLEGRNVVGRHTGNEVVVDADRRSISRRHVVIEPLGAHMALITNLSEQGTYVPADRLPEAPRQDTTLMP